MTAQLSFSCSAKEPDKLGISGRVEELPRPSQSLAPSSPGVTGDSRQGEKTGEGREGYIEGNGYRSFYFLVLFMV